MFTIFQEYMRTSQRKLNFSILGVNAGIVYAIYGVYSFEQTQLLGMIMFFCGIGGAMVLCMDTIPTQVSRYLNYSESVFSELRRNKENGNKKILAHAERMAKSSFFRVIPPVLFSFAAITGTLSVISYTPVFMLFVVLIAVAVAVLAVSIVNAVCALRCRRAYLELVD